MLYVHELAVTGYKLTNNFAGLITSGLRPDLARETPVGPRRSTTKNFVMTEFPKQLEQCL
jgi:hypothetical protein